MAKSRRTGVRPARPSRRSAFHRVSTGPLAARLYWWPMRTSRVVLVAASAVTALVVGDPARAIGPRDRHFSRARHGIGVEAPAGWTLSQHTGFGDTVVLLLHPDGSRISLSA